MATDGEHVKQLNHFEARQQHSAPAHRIVPVILLRDSNVGSQMFKKVLAVVRRAEICWQISDVSLEIVEGQATELLIITDCQQCLGEQAIRIQPESAGSLRSILTSILRLRSIVRKVGKLHPRRPATPPPLRITLLLFDITVFEQM